MMNLMKSKLYDAELPMQFNTYQQKTTPQVTKLKHVILI